MLPGMKGTKRNLFYLLLWAIKPFLNEGLEAEAVELVEYLELLLCIFESTVCFFHFLIYLFIYLFI